jgi:hypothetical protein
MIGFLDIEEFIFAENSLPEAYNFMKKVGLSSLEAVALFAGEIKGSQAIIKAVICPLQESLRTEDGLLYTVGGEELHKINIWLHKNKLKLIAQIHSHPTIAYHSETDDKYPIMSTIGGLSIVVPNFAQDSLNHLEWAYYRLSQDGIWKELDEKEIKKLVKTT